MTYVPSVADREKLALAKALLEQNLEHTITQRLLVRKTGLNRFKLTTGFFLLYGTTVSGYRLHQRMERTKILLQQPHKPLLEDIATQIGYRGSSLVARFRIYYGITPHQYRLQWRMELLEKKGTEGK
ncbi:MAG TPA: AraC family transcriptional regulator [Chitinophagaceae bacterium]|jgi:AraC-like DNA-binding protein